MQRKIKLLVWSGAIIATCSLVYAALPALLAYGIGYWLSAQGMSHIHVETGHPGWNHLQIKMLRFRGNIAGHEFSCEFHDIGIEYSLEKAIHSKLTRVRIPEATATLYPVTATKAGSRNNFHLPLATLLPGQWLSKLPIEEILLEKIRAHWKPKPTLQYTASISGYIRPTDAHVQGNMTEDDTEKQLVQFNADILQNNKATVAVTTNDGRSIFHTSVDTTPAGKGLVNLKGVLNADLGLLSTLAGLTTSLRSHLPGLKGNARSEWRTQLDFNTPFNPEKLFHALRIESDSTLDLQADSIFSLTEKSSASITTNLLLEDGVLHWKIKPESQFSGLLNTGSNRKKSAHSPLHVRISEPVTGQIELTPNAILVEVNKGKLLAIKPVQLQQFRLPATEILLNTPAQLLYNTTGGKWTTKSLSLSINSSPVYWQKNQLSNTGLVVDLEQMQGDASDWLITGKLHGHGLKTVINKQDLFSASELAGHFKLSPRQFESRASITTANGSVAIDNQLWHDFKTGIGRADMTINPVTFSTSGFRLSKILTKWTYPFDITNGQASGKGAVSWKITGTPGNTRLVLSNRKLDIQLKKIGGNLNEITFSGLNNSISLVYDKTLHTTSDSRLTVDLVQVGFPVRNINAVFQLPAQHISLTPGIKILKLDADLLGGKLRLDPFLLNPANDKNRVVVRLEKIGLKEIMELEKQEGLSGTGSMDGTLPVDITKKGIEIHDGVLNARPPGGIIKYIPNEKVTSLAKTNASIRMLAGALSDFQYSSLDINSDYAPDGTLAMKILLKGRNPQWQSGRPVHLNLNIEENIPALLKSLRLGRDIETQTRKSFKKKQ